MGFVPRHPPPAMLWFSGDRGEFRKLVTRGAGLEFITVGFYRFWLATDMRRHLWSNTNIDGDAAEYTGRARELLIGFLIALAIIVPIYLAYFLAGLEAERIKAFASLPLLAFLYVFGQFAIYRARRYRLTRTVWRGVRFWMSGSGWAYAARAALWGLLTILTLGLLLPWREAALERYKMKNSYYGDLRGSFEGRGWEFFKRGWWLWLLAPVAIYVFPLAPFVYAAFKAVQWRWWLSGIRFGGVRLESTLRRGQLIGLYWKVIGWGLLLLAAFAAYLALCAVLVASMNGTPLDQFFKTLMFQNSIPLLVLAGAGYLVTVLTLNVVIRVYLVRDLWARVIASTSVHDIQAAANVSARGELANALGEGFADGLDVAGF
ncbi:MAG TPA: DUF898 family protein [Bradyrhizobium sp.]|nr:DUF898 family protein [Bradyrhizobium sp.]